MNLELLEDFNSPALSRLQQKHTLTAQHRHGLSTEAKIDTLEVSGCFNMLLC